MTTCTQSFNHRLVGWLFIIIPLSSSGGIEHDRNICSVFMNISLDSYGYWGIRHRCSFATDVGARIPGPFATNCWPIRHRFCGRFATDIYFVVLCNKVSCYCVEMNVWDANGTNVEFWLCFLFVTICNIWGTYIFIRTCIIQYLHFAFV